MRSIFGATDPEAGNYKVTLCTYFEKNGRCRDGPSCKFAHGTQDLRLGTVVLRKNTICRNWEKGDCKFSSSNCKFAHGEDEVRQYNQDQMIKANPLHKTQMCTKYQEAEYCEMADLCAFAHGEDELRKVKKTEVQCKNLEQHGFCQFENSCKFFHGNQSGGQQTLEESMYINENNLFSNNILTNQDNMYINNMVNQENGNFSENNMTDDNMMSGVEMNVIFSPEQISIAMQGLKKHGPDYKTRICKDWMRDNKCSFAALCKHAHGEDEVWLQPDAEPGYKETICKFFEKENSCKWGDECKFAHGKKELMKYTLKPGTSPVMCKNWIDRKCVQGVNCFYTHIIPRNNPDWKVTKCRSLREAEPCTFGNLCAFAHNENELRKKRDNINHMELMKRFSVLRGMGLRSFIEFHQAEISQQTQQQHQQQVQQQEAMFSNSVQTNMIEPQMNIGVGGSAARTTLLGSSPLDEFVGSTSSRMTQLNQSNINSSMGNITTTRDISDGWSFNGGEASVIGNKSELCTKWLEDGCCMLPECNFAHGRKELLIPATAGLNLFKAELCMDIRDKGYCLLGDNCQFSHSTGIKRDYQEMSGSVGPSDPVSGQILDGKYKVVMCDKYLEGCPMGERCNHAHGYEELAFYRMKQVPNYKRSLCKSWEETGSCQWDKTCMFAHGNQDLRKDISAGPDNSIINNHAKDFINQAYAGVQQVKKIRF